MIRLNLFYLAILVLGLNIWTTNDNALYTAGLGLANIFNKREETDGSESPVLSEHCFRYGCTTISADG